MEHLTSKERTRISSALRQAWARYSEARKAVIKRGRIKYGHYKCEGCGAVLKGNSSIMAVDHIEPVGGIDAGYVGRLWCSIDNLQLLCHDCHKLKTKLERRNTPLAEILKRLRERLS